MKFWVSIWGLGLFVIYFLYRDVQLYKQIQAESRFNISQTCKSIMLDHVNAYLLQPCSDALIKFTSFPLLLPSLSANHVSYLGVVVAFISARLALSEHLFTRRIAVLVFFLRQFLDDLDGLVARYHLGYQTSKQLSITNTDGYIVDGICDAIGFFVFWFAVFLYSYNRSNLTKSTKSNVLLSNSTYSLLQSPPPTNLFKRRLIKYFILVLLQMVCSAAAWNLFLTKFHRMLDPSFKVGSEDIRTPLQDEVFKSSLIFSLMWMWRCLNPHALTNYFLVAVWLNQQTQYAKRSSQYFFFIAIGVSFLCELHFQDIKHRFEEAY